MKFKSFIFVLVALVSFFVTISPTTLAHGDHLWFVSPEQNEVVFDNVTFTVKPPSSNIPNMFISIIREGEEKPKMEVIVTKDENYSISVNIKDWEKGKYRAEAVLLGALFQHKVVREFIIQ